MKINFFSVSVVVMVHLLKTHGDYHEPRATGRRKFENYNLKNLQQASRTHFRRHLQTDDTINDRLVVEPRHSQWVVIEEEEEIDLFDIEEIPLTTATKFSTHETVLLEDKDGMFPQKSFLLQYLTHHYRNLNEKYNFLIKADKTSFVGSDDIPFPLHLEHTVDVVRCRLCRDHRFFIFVSWSYWTLWWSVVVHHPRFRNCSSPFASDSCTFHKIHRSTHGFQRSSCGRYRVLRGFEKVFMFMSWFR